MTIANAIAKHENQRLSLGHLEAAINMREEFDVQFRGAGAIENRNSYL